MKKLFGLLAAVMFLTTVSLAGAQEVIAKDKKVKFDYTLTVKDKVVDTSEGKQPLEYTQGAGMIIPGLEKEMEGLKVGDEKTVTVPAKDAYGDVNPALVITVKKANLAPEFKAEVGSVVQMQTPEGQQLPGVVKEIKDEGVVVDFNHPLAGEDLTFKIKIVEIK